MRLAVVARRVLARRTRPSTPGQVRVPIDSLVHPYRGDVLIRLQHFAFADAHHSLYEEDVAAYTDLARQTAYFLWWKHIASARYGRGRDVDASFRVRLVRSQELVSRFSPDFLAAHPIHLRWTVPGARTETGRPVNSTLHLGDGGHRLALLMHAGRTDVLPHEYRVRTEPLTTVIDNTAVLAGLLTPESLTLPDTAAGATADLLASS